MKRKGIILAGGSGTRLYPATKVISKQLLPVYDKPMVYYPLTTLMLVGIRDILVIATPADIERYQNLLQDGSQWGLNLQYAEQASPDGLAQALIIGEEFLDGSPSALILGDNLFYGNRLVDFLLAAEKESVGASIFAYRVPNPECFGVVELNDSGCPISLEEKPKRSKSNYAVTGLYFYDAEAPAIAKKLTPSKRGELEIADLNRKYLDRNRLNVHVMNRGFAWLDAGTHDGLLEASQFVRTIERRQGLKIACPEEISFRQGWIKAEEIRKLAKPLMRNEYGKYLLSLLK